MTQLVIKSFGLTLWAGQQDKRRMGGGERLVWNALLPPIKIQSVGLRNEGLLTCRGRSDTRRQSERPIVDLPYPHDGNIFNPRQYSFALIYHHAVIDCRSGQV